MKNLIKIAIGLTIIISSGCKCFPPPSQPSYPRDVKGWGVYNANGSYVLGEFALRNGESTSNSKVGISIKNIIPPEPCANPNQWTGSPKVTFNFFDPSSHEVLCEMTTLSGGISLDRKCIDKVPNVSTIYIYSINTEENWVHFELRGVP